MHNAAQNAPVPFDALALGVTHCGIYRCDASWRIRPRTIPDTDLFCVTAGSGWMRMDGARYDIRPGHLFVIRPGVTHSAGHDPDRPLTVLAMHFTAQVHGLWDLYEAFPLPERIALPAGSPVPGLLERGITEKNGGMAYGAAAAAALLRLVLVELYRLHPEACPPTGKLPAASRVMDVVTYVNAHPGTRFTIPELAERTGMSASLLQKTVRNATGLSPLNLVNRLKVNAAKLMLQRAGRTVAETAVALGFDDDAYFSRVFRKHAGLPPKQYQREIRSAAI